eukprot:PITA_09178
MNLISSPCFSVMLDGSPTSPFHPSHGIRQGDPLSPFLFILMAEGLSRLLHSAVSTETLKGISLHGLHPLSHQKFVNDTMLFGHPSSQEAEAFKHWLFLFSDASAALPSKYLGDPLLDSAIKHASWRTLLDKLESRLSSWTFRSLNMAGRLILMKSVLQAMPLYLFSILAAPKWVLKATRNLQRNFLWRSSGLNQKWALVNWKEVYQTKSEGGLGLRGPLQSNNTMGARIWWKWISKPHIPWARLWQEKYAPGSQWSDLIRINTTTPGSLTWNAAKLHSDFIQEHSFWEIHSGTTTRFWKDSWQQLPKIATLFHKPIC